MNMTGHDRTILRELARRIADIAALPIMERRRHLWAEHNSLRPTRPLILVFPEGGWVELITEADMQCETAEARFVEWNLRSRLYTFEHFDDDTVVEATWEENPVIHGNGWGLEPRYEQRLGERGMWKVDPVLNGSADLKKLHAPELDYDERETRNNLQYMTELLGDLLEVRLRGVSHISYHLMNQYIRLRGLEQTMLDMYENPGMLHSAMSILEEGHHRILRQYTDFNLLALNNNNTYNSTGGNGYTDQLPAPGFDPSHVRPRDMWASAEAQELAAVSPEMHHEFSMQYEKRLLEPFGLTGYGCCEDLTAKLDYVLTIPHIRRISVSPWADVAVCAKKLNGGYILSWKPNPSYLCGDFNPESIRADLAHGVAASRAHGCVLEIILKDTHTVENRPERFDRWTKIAKEIVEMENVAAWSA